MAPVCSRLVVEPRNRGERGASVRIDWRMAEAVPTALQAMNPVPLPLISRRAAAPMARIRRTKVSPRKINNDMAGS